MSDREWLRTGSEFETSSDGITVRVIRMQRCWEGSGGCVVQWWVFLNWGRSGMSLAEYNAVTAWAVKEDLGYDADDYVVGLALDPVYDQSGQRREDLSHMWVDNDYVLDLRTSLGDKVLLGASVHPYDKEFEARVRQYVEAGAVLLKWLPSSQQIDLGDERVRRRLQFLATVRDGAPLPVLLHVGPEYAIPSMDPGAAGYDCLSWNWWDGVKNRFRGDDRCQRRSTTVITGDHYPRPHTPPLT